MVITDIQTERQTILLNKPFKTALRTVTHAQSVIVRLSVDNGLCGWGEAVPTMMITGESIESIEAAICQTINLPPTEVS
ncbi:Mandelate racemase/muconate lactonizing protein, partial [Caldalkalibacillus thermarum TA2.A1]